MTAVTGRGGRTWQGDLERRRANRRRAWSVAAVPAGVFGVVAFGIGWAAGGPLAAVIAAALASSGCEVLVLTEAGCLALRLVGARPAELPRVQNLAEHLCAASGVNLPEIWSSPSEFANCACVSAPRGPARLVVTAGLVQRLSLIELEGVVAHMVCFLRSGGVLPSTVAVAAGWPLWGRPGVIGRRTLALHAEADLDAVALTRYPPGLAAALETLPDTLPVAGLAARLSGPLWLVSPAAPGGPRAAALREL